MDKIESHIILFTQIWTSPSSLSFSLSLSLSLALSHSRTLSWKREHEKGDWGRGAFVNPSFNVTLPRNVEFEGRKSLLKGKAQYG
jgi:hypothetical protein